MENCHIGHRQRLLDSVCKFGLKNLNEYQILEYILTFIIPRKDTNDLAHALLKKFGSISKIFDANYLDLMTVEGLGETTAKKLSTFKDICQLYCQDKAKNSVYVKDMKDLYSFAKTKFMFIEEEQLLLVGLNKYYKIKAVIPIKSIHVDSVSVSFKEIINFIAKYNIDKILLMHNHPNGDSSPSMEDVESTNIINKLCASNLVPLQDHIIFGDKEIYSMKLTRKFYEKDLL